MITKLMLIFQINKCATKWTPQRITIQSIKGERL